MRSARDLDRQKDVAMQHQGVLYIAYGENARQEAAISIQSLRDWHRDLPIAVIGEAVKGAKHIPFVSQDQIGRWAKVNLDLLTQWEQTLYLDADTRVRQPITAGFEMLNDGWDLVMVPSRNQKTDWLWHVGEEERRATILSVGTRATQLQAGLMFFRQSASIRRLFAQWRAEWERYRGQDQAALLRAIYQMPLKLWLLGKCWNGGAIVEHHFGAARRR